jgi:stage IV sporulation protein FB
MGISIEVHITFLLFLFLILLAGFANFLFFLIIFMIVLSHELCHSIAAILSGIPVPRIILLPFGGLASIELPENPMTELKISLSGPFFNFFFAGVGFLLIKLLGFTLLGYDQVVYALVGGVGVFTVDYVLSMLVMTNLVIGLFNMVPAFPMDGGRVLRSVLALWVDYAKATEIAGKFGQVIFLFLILDGLFESNLWWIIVGFFLMYASGSEVRFVLLRKTFDGLFMRDLVSHQRRLSAVDGALRVDEFLRLVARPNQRVYLVVNSDGSLRGVLDLHRIAGLPKDGAGSVGSLAAGGYGLVEGRMRVADAMREILSKDVTLVVDESTVVGFVTPESFMEFTDFYGLGRDYRPKK